MHDFEAVLVEHCAPTLAGVKPASLFRYEPDGDLSAVLTHWTQLLASHGLTLRVMKKCAKTGSVLLYLYRAAWVRRIVSEPPCRTFLNQIGYGKFTNLDALLRKLSVRFCMEQDFPHEVGIFLGYPLCDVQGFMQHKGRDYTCCGQWKCYGDADEAKKRFALLRKCTQVYRQLYQTGTPIGRLIVAA